MATKSKRIKIKLAHTDEAGKQTYFYTAYTNTQNNGQKIVLKKYHPVLRKHVEFKETKIK